MGALAVARLCEALGTPFALGGVAWERIVIDPKPGPRPLAEIDGGRPLGDHAMLADPATATDGGARFAEAGMAEHLGAETVLIDVTGGARGAQEGIEAAAAELGCDLLLCVDVGGDVLAHGGEPGLASPLCDAVMVAAALGAAQRLRPLLAVIGPGCDGELATGDVLRRIAELGQAGAWLGAWGVTPEVADELEAATELVPTEASMQVVRCARGEIGTAPIRRGRRHVELGPVGALTFLFDPLKAPREALPLAAAVADTDDIEEGRGALERLGVRTELDYERSRAGEGP